MSTYIEAKILAERYSYKVKRDITTEGYHCFIAHCPELPGCMAQGETMEEAIKNLEDAKVDYIESLLEDGLDIP